jgi:hypothetical protein
VVVINGVAATPFLVVVMRVSGSRRIMGDYVNGNAASVLGWLTAALMAAAAIALFATAESASDRPASCPHSRKGAYRGMRRWRFHGARARRVHRLILASDR